MRCPAAGRSSHVWTTRSTSITSSWPTTTLRARACSRASVTGFKAVLRAHFWALVALIAGLGGPAGAAPVAAVDATGARVELVGPATRIVSLAPHATELVFAAGAGERVVGVLAPADWPPEAARVPRVGTAAGVDLERIVALKPDLVIVWPYLAPAQIERLRALGIPVFVSDPRTPAAIAAELERLGTLDGTRASAAGAAAAFRAGRSALGWHERGRAIRSVAS